MAIEDDDIRDREIWTAVSRHWYSEASDKAPTAGRLYHHLAILARPNALQQLFHYAKALYAPVPSRTNTVRKERGLLCTPDFFFLRSHFEVARHPCVWGRGPASIGVPVLHSPTRSSAGNFDKSCQAQPPMRSADRHQTPTTGMHLSKSCFLVVHSARVSRTVGANV